MLTSLSSRVVVAACIFAAPSAFADLTVDVIGPTDITFEALFQADKNFFSNDFRRGDGSALSAAERSSQTFADDAGMRRAELIFKGRTQTADWSVAYEARANRWLDVFFRQRVGSFSSWRLGQFKQNNSLEELANTRHNDFVAKAVTTSAFAIARRLGAEFATGGDPWTLTGSIFNREITNSGQRSDGYTVRGTLAPIMQITPPDNDAENVLHLGLSYVAVDPSKNVVRINPRPEADFANVRLVDTLNLTDVEDSQQLGAEAMWLYGPLKLSAEYVDANYERASNPDYQADSWYVSGVYTLTGEKFRYRGGIYTLPMPATDAGMWQIGARFSRINANDGLVRGGKQDVATVGVNWYWRLNFKFMLNYSAVQSERGSFVNDPNVLELRAQIVL